MKLSALISAAEEKGQTGLMGSVFQNGADGADPDIGSLHYRSQEIVPGGLFVAIPGHTADGHDYIGDALARGAAAVIVERTVSHNGVFVKVSDSRRALAHLAAAFYGAPSEDMSLVGITGTNGKTTVTYLVESILVAAGFLPGIIGTVNCRFAGKTLDSPVTTPESLDLQRILFDMKQHGVTHVVMEVSSHAIDLARVRSCWFDVGAFTNLSQDHLDYHKTMDAYWVCKRRFFTEYLTEGPKARGAVAVVNTDNTHGDELHGFLLEEAAGHEPISYGHNPNNDVRPVTVAVDKTGIYGDVMTPAGKVSIHSKLAGGHNLENILCAVGIAVGLDVPLAAIEAGIAGVSRIPGRLERVGNESDRFVFVDYAHTPDALENVLKTLHAISDQRIICIFGCGGDRDADKRPLMGRIAGKLSDVVIITSDNPRTESPQAIIDQIVSGIRQTASSPIESSDGLDAWQGKGYLVAPDRREAIRLGARAARPGDMVLIAGKGHETYQIIGTEKIPFDDRQVAEEAVRALRGMGKGHG